MIVDNFIYKAQVKNDILFLYATFLLNKDNAFLLAQIFQKYYNISA